MRFGLSTYLPEVLYVVGILVWLVTLFYRKEIGLYFIVMLLPMQVLIDKLHPFPMGKDIVDVYIVTLLLLCFLKPATKDDESSGMWVPTRPILLYVLLTYLYLWLGSLALGLDLPFDLDNERFMDWKNHIIMPVLFLITLKIIREKRQIVLLASLMLLSMFFVSFHFYRNFSHTGGHFRWERRDSGAFSYLGPNEIGAFWAEYSFIILGLLFLGRLSLLWRWPLAGLLVLNLYCLVYSFSRGAYLAFAAAFLFISSASKNIKALAVFVLFLGFWTAFVPQSVVERIEMTETEEGGLESSSQGRLNRWSHGFNLFLGNPLGRGWGTVRFLGFSGAGGEASSHGDPHNAYVEFLVEMGIPGITLFLYLFFLAFRSGWKLYSEADDGFLKGLGLGFAATVVACMVANIFGDRWTYVMVGAFYWVFWALVVRSRMIVHMGKQKAMSSP